MVKNEEAKYPVSEMFVSPQGEGVYTGTTMFFVRLGGCTVGKPFPKEMYKDRELPLDTPGNISGKALPVYTEKCTLYDGREFACDTDYRVKERLTAQQILQRVPDGVDRVCITGGEPLMHKDISALVQTLHCEGNRHIHIETSGTISFDMNPVWITVSPKKDVQGYMLSRADEIKLLVDENFSPENLILPTLVNPISLATMKPIFLHPVNHEHTVNGANLKRCMDWQKKYPQFRVGIQLHKAISLYTEEFVR